MATSQWIKPTIPLQAQSMKNTAAEEPKRYPKTSVIIANILLEANNYKIAGSSLRDPARGAMGRSREYFPISFTFPTGSLEEDPVVRRAAKHQICSYCSGSDG